ncbi:MAG: hypothetical protein ACO377_02330 [Pseudomonadales bacterium]
MSDHPVHRAVIPRLEPAAKMRGIVFEIGVGDADAVEAQFRSPCRKLLRDCLERRVDARVFHGLSILGA